MNPMHIVASTITGSGILIVLLSIPLIYRRVPPNCTYGIRIRAAFGSEEEWYRINTTGGRYFVVSGLVIAAAGIAGFFLPESLLPVYGTIAGAVTLIAAVLPWVLLQFWKPRSSR
jgi:uncharacterized membrane protein